MVQFFQVLFLLGAVIILVQNFLEFQKWQEGQKQGALRKPQVKWLHFILTSVVAIGCIINVIAAWVNKA